MENVNVSSHCSFFIWAIINQPIHEGSLILEINEFLHGTAHTDIGIEQNKIARFPLVAFVYYVKCLPSQLPHGAL